MDALKNLTVIRRLVQLAAFVFLVYGSVVVGYYTADKLSGAFPALTCAYDHQAADYCTLVPFQHQMAHRVGDAISKGTSLWLGLLPVGITLATFLVLFVLLNKAFCGWICPLGFFQEVLGLIGQKLGLQQRESLPAGVVGRLRPVKWMVLGGLVFGLPLLSGLGFVGHEFVGAYCAVCPSRILTSLAVGDTSQLYFDTAGPGVMVLSVIADFLFGAIVALALTTRQPFCRVCPMLALHAAFRKVGLARLVKSPTARCEKCGICAKVCPMDIREIHTTQKRGDITFADCTLCGRCVEFCPETNVLQLKYTVFPVFSSGPAYFKRRKQAQKRWDAWSLRSWLGRRRAPTAEQA